MSKKANSELLFYKQYHNHPINKLIHVICIPIIAVTLANLFAILFPISISLPFLSTITNFRLQGDSILIAIYIPIYWIQWPKKIAKVMTVWMAVIWYLAIFSRNYWGESSWRMNSLYIHVAAWVLQFVGHGIEGRKPALLDSLKQAFISAPVFSLEPYFPSMFEELK